MDNIDALKFDDIDTFLNEKISSDNEINDESTAKILEESNKLLNNLIYQLYYLYYQSLHYDFNEERELSYTKIKKLSSLLNAFFDFNQNPNLSINRLIEEIEKTLNKSQSNDLLLTELNTYYPKKCPITQAPFNDPVTQRFSSNSNTCNHTFERSAISKYLATYDKACPVSGCGAHVLPQNLVKDWDVLHKTYTRELSALIEPFTSKLKHK